MSDMTREEAKELFEDNFTAINTHGHYTKEEEGQAQEWAISALSEEPAYINNDTAEKLDQILIWGYCFCSDDDNEFCKAIKNAIEIITALETLKAEIRDNANHCECVPDGSCISVNKALEIIDKHIKGVRANE